MNQVSAPGGDLFYVSERKLANLAVQFGVKTGSLGPDVSLEAGGSVSAGLPPLGGASVQGSVRAEHTDPAGREKALARQLDQVIGCLGDLPVLEDGADLQEGEWFRFHRPLRFGVGRADSPPSVTAFVMVDSEPVPEGPLIPGLLMNGSVAHVRAPYATDELRNSPGSRSGSGTGRLFIWLEELREALEANPLLDLSRVEAQLLEGRRAPRSAQAALSMYRLFAQDEWLQSSLIPRLLDGGPCEGVAQASLIAVGEEETTLVMGSPLYTRVRTLPKPPEDEPSEQEARGFVSRLFGRSAA